MKILEELTLDDLDHELAEYLFKTDLGWEHRKICEILLYEVRNNNYKVTIDQLQFLFHYKTMYCWRQAQVR